MIGDKTLENFKSLTNFDFDDFTDRVSDFFRFKMPKIVTFYTGSSKFIDKECIDTLNKLYEESLVLTGIFRDYKRTMSTCDYWTLLDIAEDVKTHLRYAQQIPKFLRSSIVKGKIKAGYVFSYTMSQEQTIEDVAYDVLGQTNDFNNSAWVNIAVMNDLREVDWDIQGGTDLELLDNSFQASLVTSMIDYNIGDRIYGKDIPTLMKFDNDDLAVLGYKDTAYQTVDILSTLGKRDIPEYPDFGLNAQFWKGVNISRMNFPLIKKELERNFGADDLFKNFKVLEIDYIEGDIFIKFEVGTKRDEVIVNSVTI
mgnify:CR=1 FL=1